MNTNFITLNKENIDQEHICCAFSDKKCQESYLMKKEWLKQAFSEGYTFRRLDERAKVFIEYGPAEKAWAPVKAPNYVLINCLWVSGQYKGKGYAKALLDSAIEEAKQQGKAGLITIAGAPKFHFMNDTKWFIRQGFEMVQKLPNNICLLAYKLKPESENPCFRESAFNGECSDKNGLVVYYSNRCPFAEFHVQHSLQETAQKRNIPLKIVKLETMEEAQNAPTPATIFSLFYDGKFITTDISACMDSRFDKVVKSYL